MSLDSQYWDRPRHEVPEYRQWDAMTLEQQKASVDASIQQVKESVARREEILTKGWKATRLLIPCVRTTSMYRIDAGNTTLDIVQAYGEEDALYVYSKQPGAIQ